MEPKLVIGIAWSPGYWYAPLIVQDKLKAQLIKAMPALQTCLKAIPTANNTFLNFLYTSGTLEKSMHASFTDVDYRMFNDQRFGGPANANTMQMLKANYGSDIAVATYTTYDLSLPCHQV